MSTLLPPKNSKKCPDRNTKPVESDFCGVTALGKAAEFSGSSRLRVDLWTRFRTNKGLWFFSQAMRLPPVGNPDRARLPQKSHESLRELSSKALYHFTIFVFDVGTSRTKSKWANEVQPPAPREQNFVRPFCRYQLTKAPARPRASDKAIPRFSRASRSSYRSLRPTPDSHEHGRWGHLPACAARNSPLSALPRSLTTARSQSD